MMSGTRLAIEKGKGIKEDELINVLINYIGIKLLFKTINTIS